MSLATILPLVALAASVFLVISSQTRVPAIAALVASALEVLIRIGKVHLSVAYISVSLLLGLLLLVAAGFAYVKATSKATISAATLIVLVGSIQVLRGLNIL